MENIFNPVIPLFIIIPAFAAVILLFLFFMIKRRFPGKRIAATVVRLAIISALVVIINARYMTARQETITNARNLDVLFVLDNTLSMYADDCENGRMSLARATCKYLMDNLEGANFALIQFDNNAQILSPFTQDSMTISDALATINRPDEYYATGTSLNVAHDTMKELLASSAEKENRKTIVFFLSDGEITSDENLESFSDLSDYINDGAVLGFGTEKGGSMKTEYSYMGEQYISDSDGFIAVSKLDEDNLEKLADDMSVKYIHVTSTDDLENTADRILRSSREIPTKSDAVSYDDTYFYWTLPLLVILILELTLYIRKNRL